MEDNLNLIGQGISNYPDRPVPMEYVYQSPAFSRDNIGNHIAGGLANALEMFTQDRLREIKRKKSVGLLTDMGIKPEVARFLQDIREQDPNAYTQLVQNLGTSAYKQRPENQSDIMGGSEVGGMSPFGKESAEAKDYRKLQMGRAKTLLESYQKRTDASSKLEDKARIAYDFLEKNKNKIPNQLRRSISKGAAAQYNEYKRTLEGYLNDIVADVAALNAAGSGFRSGKALTDLAATAKANIDQPIGTMEKLLENLLRQTEKVKQENAILQGIRKQAGGRWPIDLADRFNDAIAQRQDLEEDMPQAGDVRVVNGKKQAWDPRIQKWREDFDVV